MRRKAANIEVGPGEGVSSRAAGGRGGHLTPGEEGRGRVAVPAPQPGLPGGLHSGHHLLAHHPDARPAQALPWGLQTIIKAFSTVPTVYKFFA